jgi:uncharacterized protein (TIGR02246 family)
MQKQLIRLLPLLILCTNVLAGPREEALAVVEKWGKAFIESDVDAIVKLYAPDALFFGTGSKALVTTPEGVRTYFEQALLINKPKSAALGDHSVMVLSDTTVVVAGLDAAGGVRDGKPYSADGRVTFVIAKRADGWQIVHFHRSATPN